jgi:CMP-N,N'-diacetyllegionaminic acid synthase
MYKVLAIIPARAGSKGLPNKNIKLLNNKPLISWTIEAALNSKLIDKIIVSTDDIRIMDITSSYGIQKTNLRPESLSKGNSLSDDVIKYEMRKFPEHNVIIMLQPTSPLRSSIHIDDALSSFFKKRAKSLVSVFELKKSPFWAFTVEKGYLKSLFDIKTIPRTRQKLKTTYMLNGAIYISLSSFFEEQGSFITNETMYYEMKENESIDIDDLDDFKLAENILSKSIDKD